MGNEGLEATARRYVALALNIQLCSRSNADLRSA